MKLDGTEISVNSDVFFLSKHLSFYWRRNLTGRNFVNAFLDALNKQGNKEELNGGFCFLGVASSSV